MIILNFLLKYIFKILKTIGKISFGLFHEANADAEEVKYESADHFKIINKNQLQEQQLKIMFIMNEIQIQMG